MQIPGYSQLKRTYRDLSPAEFGVFVVLGVAVVVSAIGLAGQAQNEISTTTPVQGGSYSEGIVGFPRYINPVLASTDTDQDLSALIYSGLTKINADGDVEMDLAEEMSVSNNGETYTFEIDPEAQFHDGHPLQADDVVYTINMIKNQRINSPYQADWNQVNVRAKDEQTVVFDLQQPFQEFPYNARIGILPKHLWQEETTESFPFSNLNTSPIGSGPYQISEINRNTEGIPTYYELSPAGNGEKAAFIKSIEVELFPDTQSAREALADGDVDTLYNLSPAEAKEYRSEGRKVFTRPLNRIFAVFFNQNQNEALAEQNVRKALADVIPKEEIVKNVLEGFASSLNGPLPAETISDSSNSDSQKITTDEAASLLEEAGWELDEDGNRMKGGEVLSVSLTTADITSLTQTAEMIKSAWEDIGVSVNLTSMPTSELSREKIRPREYEALLFGQSFNQNRDLYPFWHSSAQNDPGLNLSMYTNSDIDDSLTELRTASSSERRSELRESIAESISNERPAAFLYSPAFIYVLPEKIKNVEMPPVSIPADRFAQVEDWYIETTKLWNIFSEEDEGEAANQDEVDTATTSPESTTTPLNESE